MQSDLFLFPLLRQFPQKHFSNRRFTIFQLLAAAEGFRFFSSSLLIAFDAKTDKIDPDSCIELKMIDFAHSTFEGFLNDERHYGPDEGYLLGIDSLVDLLTNIVNHNLT